MTLTIGQINDFRNAYNKICRLSADVEQLEMGMVRISILGYNFYVERTKREVERKYVSLLGTKIHKEDAEMFLVTDDGESEVCCLEDWNWVLGEMLAYIARVTQEEISRNRTQFEDYLGQKAMETEIDEDAREDFRESQRVRSEI